MATRDKKKNQCKRMESSSDKNLYDGKVCIMKTMF